MNEEEIRRLVQLFESLSLGQRQRYSEDDTKANLIEPLFRALGWHMDDEQEVQRNRRAGSDQPDYAFRLNGVTQFFLEAKRLREDLDNMDWVKQAVSYAFNKGVPWAILTNFQRLIVFDAYEELSGVQARPRPVLDLSCDRFLAPGPRLGLLGRDDGPLRRLAQYAEEIGARRRPVPPERQLYEAMRSWREGLVNALLLATGASSEGDTLHVEEAVQRLLDRLMFLRNCEDRGVGQPRLREVWNELTRTGRGRRAVPLAERLQQVFATAATTYNSELFATTSYLDVLLPQVDGLLSEALTEVLNGLYQAPRHRLAPYDFKQIDADVLGAMYEQYLGHVAQRRRELAAQHERQLALFLPGATVQVDIAPQRRRRKEQGIFYTPRWVVDYIVRQTVGRWLEEHGDNAESLDHLAVLDPASGSGSFLIQAYETLLDYHAERQGGTVDHLDRRVRERLLRRHIYGVDLDRQAVEISRLNLLLRMVQEEELLPPLAENIVWGNSLVSGGEAELRPWFGDAWEERHPLTWERTYREVMERGGFDVVIGNPPYVRIQALPEPDRNFYRGNFASAYGSFDLYVLFVERALMLLRDDGFLGFIMSGKFLKSEYGKRLINLLQERATIDEIVDLSAHQIFEDATTYPVIVLARKTVDRDPLRYTHIPATTEVEKSSQIDTLRDSQAINAPQSVLSERIWPPATGRRGALLEKLTSKGPKLGDVVERIFVGLQTSADDVFVLQVLADQPSDGKTIRAYSKSTDQPEILESTLVRPLLRGQDIQRYKEPTRTSRLLFPYTINNRQATLVSMQDMELQYPLTYDYLNRNRERLENRESGRWRTDRWYAFGRTQNLGLHEDPKIAIPRLVKRLECYADLRGEFLLDNVDVNGLLAPNDSIFLSTLLNSKLLNYIFSQQSAVFRGGYLSANRQFISTLPIKAISITEGHEVERHDRIVRSAERMLVLQSRLAAKAGIRDAEAEAIERELRETDQAIDDLVYDLYALTAEERRMIEEEVGPRR